MSGNRDDHDDARIDALIEKSSLGTPGARQLRDRIPRAEAQGISRLAATRETAPEDLALGSIRARALAALLVGDLARPLQAMQRLDRILENARASDHGFVLVHDPDRIFDLDRDLARARGRVRDLDRILALESVLALSFYSVLDLESVLGRCRGLASDLDRALGRFRGLARDLDLELDFNGARDYVRVGDLDRDLVRDLAHGFEVAVSIARRVQEGLRAREVDASGSDLSGMGEISDIELLDRVVWTRQTIWPPGIVSLVEAHSEKIGDGVYKVRVGGRPVRAAADA